MSTIVNDIINHIELQLVEALPNDFSRLSHVIDVAKNKFKGASNRYGVLPLGASQNNLNTKAYALDHTFEVLISNGYRSSKLISDSNQREAAIDLQDYCLDVYKRLQINRDLATVKQVLDMSLSEPEHDTDNHIVIQRMTFTIKYENRF